MMDFAEAYRKMKEQTNDPIIYFAENDKHFIGANTFYIFVDKISGEITKQYDVVSFLIATEFKELKLIYHQELFDDFIEFYRKNNDEKSLASLYALVWKEVFFGAGKGKLDTKNSDDSLSIWQKWKEIEVILHDDILNIIDKEDIDYPPCVLKNFDDHFFRIKPFMLRYGYTDNGDRLWEKNAARLSPLEAYKRFVKKYPEKSNVISIFDFGDFYHCDDGFEDDFGGLNYLINPYTGETTEMDSSEFFKIKRKYPVDEDIKEYKISDLLVER